jgi:hypothetical integral membrane protein (TIGR02206 family)
MQPFIAFGPDHLAVLAVLVVGSAGLLLARGRLRRPDDRRLRRAIAGAILVNEAVGYAVGLAQGVVRVPLQLCDLALAMTVWALLTLQPAAAVLAYFWAFAGSLQAIVTPDLAYGFPHYGWLRFFLSHCGVILSAVYLAVTGRVRPTASSVWWVWLVTNGYAGVAGGVNWAFGTNFGYLARKPLQPSLLDAFGPWPYYILGMEVAALGSFFLYYAPFALARRVAPRHR